MSDHRDAIEKVERRLWKDSPLKVNEKFMQSQIDIMDRFTDAVEKSVNQSLTNKRKTDMHVQKFPKSEEK